MAYNLEEENRKFFTAQALKALEKIAEIKEFSIEAKEIAEAIARGDAPSALSHGFFAKLMEMSRVERYIEYQKGASTVNKYREEWSRDDVGKIDERLNSEITGITALCNLAGLGLVPSEEQRGLLVQRLKDICALEGPMDTERSYVQHGISRARSDFRHILCRSAHVLDLEQLHFMLSTSKTPMESFEIIRKWAENGVYQADIAAFFEKELTSMLRDKWYEGQTRLDAHALRNRIESMKAASVMHEKAGIGKALVPPKRKV